MPHDKNGRLLKIGDTVIIEGKIKEIHNTEEYCNCTIEIDPMPPYTDPYILSAINTKQVQLYGRNEVDSRDIEQNK